LPDDFLAIVIADFVKNHGRLSQRYDRVRKLTYHVQGTAKVVERHSQAAPVADLPEDVDRHLVLDDCLVKPIRAFQDAAEAYQRHCLALPIACPPVNGDSLPACCDGLRV